MVKDYLILIFCFFIVCCTLCLSCVSKKDYAELIPREYNSKDSVWINFKNYLEKSDTFHIYANSADSIQCIDCGDNGMFTIKEALKGHYSSFWKSEDFKSKDFYLRELDTNSLEVLYTFPSRNFSEPDHGYFVSFRFLKINGTYKFYERLNGN